MHGGKGSGAPKGNRNALRHGAYTKEVLAKEATVRELCSQLRAKMKLLKNPGVVAHPSHGRRASDEERRK